MIALTEAASKKVKDAMREQGLEGHSLRVFVSGGGCSGLQYGMSFTNEAQENDHVFELHGVRVVVDPLSMQYLEDAEIDYASDLMGSGFRIKNPNAQSTCSCGQSFSCG